MTTEDFDKLVEEIKQKILNTTLSAIEATTGGCVAINLYSSSLRLPRKELQQAVLKYGTSYIIKINNADIKLTVNYKHLIAGIYSLWLGCVFSKRIYDLIHF